MVDHPYSTAAIEKRMRIERDRKFSDGLKKPKFVPTNELCLEDALDLTGRRLFGGEWAGDEVRRSYASDSYLDEQDDLIRHADELGLEAHQLCEEQKQAAIESGMHSRTQEELRVEAARDHLRRLLHDGLVRSVRMDETGNREAICSTIWAGSIGERGLNEGSIYGSKTDRVKHGFALVNQQDLVDALEGRPRQLDGIGMPPNKAKKTQSRNSYKRGRTPKWDWDAMWAELCSIVHEEGLPADQATLVKRLEGWFIDREDTSLAVSEIKRSVSKAWHRIKQAEK